jgi:phage-related protein
MIWTVEFLDDAIADEVLAWPKSLQAALTRILDRIRSHGLDSIGMPLARHVEGKLWELRASGKNAEGRALYVAASGRRVVVVLVFIKKTEKTPPRIVRRALEKAKEVI